MDDAIVNILLIEDNPVDILVTKEALKEAKVRNELIVIDDGIDALDYLYNRGEYITAKRPDLILLDLNLPRKTGTEILSIIKKDEKLLDIPVIVLTTSANEQDILQTYRLHANCYITKPVDMDQFVKAVRRIEGFWFNLVKLPHNECRPVQSLKS